MGPQDRFGVRPARNDDAVAIATLARQLGYPVTTIEAARRLRILVDTPTETVLVAVAEDDRVVGWIHATGRRTLLREASAEIVGLVVDEALRGQGHGRRLVQAVVDWARDAGLASLRVRASTVRQATHGFYEHLGLRRDKTQHVFERKLAARRR